MFKLNQTSRKTYLFNGRLINGVHENKLAYILWDSGIYQCTY